MHIPMRSYVNPSRTSTEIFSLLGSVERQFLVQQGLALSVPRLGEFAAVVDGHANCAFIGKVLNTVDDKIEEVVASLGDSMCHGFHVKAPGDIVGDTLVDRAAKGVVADKFDAKGKPVRYEVIVDEVQDETRLSDRR